MDFVFCTNVLIINDIKLNLNFKVKLSELLTVYIRGILKIRAITAKLMVFLVDRYRWYFIK